MKRLVVMAMVVTLMSAFTISAAMAQEKAKTDKEKAASAQAAKKEWPKLGPNAKLLLENEKVRVVETHAKPGEKNPMVKRGPRVVYVLKGGPVKVYYADGKTEMDELKTGTVRYYPGGDTKSTETLGKTERRNLIINFAE
jgi:hypothetical protein